ncbi:type III restriction-modification system endonuclease [Sulfurimonas paralvinellae]|uniref:Type III restriction endonuclease subunit R n=1 Tax=Sulfurimonas paralvinellae TaxID=317658 RepID=A0A7M1B729_9BACT|nr:DEAD/DEAH box helicase family protein [Sulfurimonas paralvinellae]QOP45549.1 type III restriction endonuclease subunit R [Sulfurimonas paralvinellae]
MKIQFESNLNYQNKAISSIVDIFEGQEICQSNFSVSRVVGDTLGITENELGIGNRLELLDDEILANVQKIQLKNGLPQSKKLSSMDFSVEMETGTGKTYVYLKTIFELSRKYGFTKFIIVVPSIAIKEGVKKTLDITTEHFKSLFDNVNYDHFVYDSSNLEQVRDFATSSDIRIMVINIDAFRKSFTDPSKDTKANIIHRQNDRLNGERPIDFIASTNPILIIDEPQSVDNTSKAKEAIEKLNPLCKLRYSATHIEKFNLMYKLDSIDAYEQKLVKQIEVANVKIDDSSNKAYIKLLSVKANPRSAKVEIDITKNGNTSRKTITIKDGSDLYELSNGRDVYSGYTVNDIYIEKGNEYIEFSNGESVGIGEVIGDIDDDSIKQLQIRKTIEEHLDKELRLTSKGIKVLSLFFIDRVANYRTYDEEGNPQKGKYARWFEEAYKEISQKRKYKTLFEDVDISADIEKIHDGYFAQDRSGKLKDSTGKNKDDESAFDKIMKNKEKLLSFSEPLRFIFSHSALKEGWDNPNVFQICTLNETNSVMKKRQEIGRGLRICVNQDGERVQGFYVNTLTVMANESYEEFAKSLQAEIEQEEGIKFGVIEEHFFANIPIKNEEGDVEYFGADNSEAIFAYLKENDYIDSRGKIQDSLKLDIKNEKFEVPAEYQNLQAEITSVIKKIAGNLNIKDASDRKLVTLNKEVLLSDDFKELWERVKYKTTYRVDFDIDSLVNKCAEKIANELTIGKIKYLYSKAKNKITKVGVEVDLDSVKEQFSDVEIIDYELPDIITYLQNETNLTRKNIVDILIKSGKLESFKNNPQKFIDGAIKIIKKTMSIFIVDGIKYQKIGNDSYYAQECFEDQELYGYLSKNMIENRENKSIYNYTVYDSDVEKGFARSFNENEDVKLFTKLPSWFKINTPLGGYNPDWAVLIEKDNEEKLYFVVESKGSLFTDDLRDTEEAKIKCATEHFKEISTETQFIQSNNFEHMREFL